MISLLIAATFAQLSPVPDSARPNATDTVRMLSHHWTVTAVGDQTSPMQNLPKGKEFPFNLNPNGKCEFLMVENAPEMNWRYDDGVVQLTSGSGKNLRPEATLIIRKLNNSALEIASFDGNGKMKMVMKRADLKK